MKKILFLVHRIPYPPNKGDKVRSFHLLRHLASRYRVHLGVFIDEAEDWQYSNNVRDLCEEAFFCSLDPVRARLKSISGFFSGKALTIPYYKNSSMQTWVDRTLEGGDIGRIVIFSSAMAQYISDELYERCTTIIDHVDVDSDKWAQYSRSKNWPLNLVFRREGTRLLNYERRIAEKSKFNIFVSSNEACLFKKLAPAVAEKVGYVNNGVDSEYFSPMRHYPNPFPNDKRILVFTGAMDYWPNVDAVRWFSLDVLPRVVARIANAEFYIVGARPQKNVQALAANPHVQVIGAVDDMRPYLAHAHVAVAPLRLARGVQNKVLEAMAMALPVAATSQAISGITYCEELSANVADQPELLANIVTSFLHRADRQAAGKRLRQFVVANYDWCRNLERFSDILEGNLGTRDY